MPRYFASSGLHWNGYSSWVNYRLLKSAEVLKKNYLNIRMRRPTVWFSAQSTQGSFNTTLCSASSNSSVVFTLEACRACFNVTVTCFKVSVTRRVQLCNRWPQISPWAAAAIFQSPFNTISQTRISSFILKIQVGLFNVHSSTSSPLT